MNAFRNIDALLRVIAREKELLKFLFTGRKAPSLRPEQAIEHFLEGDERRLNLLLEHGVIRKTEEGGVLMLEETYLRFFEEVLEVNEEINVQSVKQHIDALNENIELWLTAGTDPQRFRYMGEILRILRNISLSTHRNVIDLKRNIDSTYKNERDYALKRKRLEIMDRKRADIALLIREAEKVMENAPLKETVAEVKTSLTESYHNLLELDRQIIQYLNKIEAEQKLVEKIRRVKYLKDQLIWEQSTDALFCLQTYRPAFLEKRPWYNFLPSLDSITNTSDGLAALKEAHKALKHPVVKRKVETEPLTEEEIAQRALVRDTMNTFELRNAFLGSSTDLMSFLQREEALSGALTFFFAEERVSSLCKALTLFCRLAAEYYEDFHITDQYVEVDDYSYPLIYPR